jgi:hypothetical protein
MSKSNSSYLSFTPSPPKAGMVVKDRGFWKWRGPLPKITAHHSPRGGRRLSELEMISSRWWFQASAPREIFKTASTGGLSFVDCRWLAGSLA